MDEKRNEIDFIVSDTLVADRGLVDVVPETKSARLSPRGVRL
jgi:hypothetical protein